MRLTALSILVTLVLNHAAGQDHTVPITSPFNQLKVSGNIHLQLVPSHEQHLTFASKDQLAALEISEENGRLELRTRSELGNNPAIGLALSYVSLSGIEITKGGRVQSADTLIADFLQLDAESGGKIELMIRVDSLSARVNLGADIILYGVATTQYVNAYSWGNYLAYELAASSAYVKAATGAQVKVNVNSLLDANATSKAFIGYRGTPSRKQVKTSVGGEVLPWTE